MNEFKRYVDSRVKEAKKETAGWIQFMPEEGKKAAQLCTFRLQPIERWRPDVSFPPHFDDECTFEKYVLTQQRTGNYKNDILEGRCVNHGFPNNTEFASCFTIIRKEDLDCNGRLKQTKIDELQRYGTGHCHFIYIKNIKTNNNKETNLEIFELCMYNAAIKAISDPANPGRCSSLALREIPNSSVSFRPVAYLSPQDYYRMGVEIEGTSDISGGMPTVKDEQEAKNSDALLAGTFGIFAKLDFYEKQREARMGLTFSRPIKKPWEKSCIDIWAPSTKQFFDVCKASEIYTITFS